MKVHALVLTLLLPLAAMADRTTETDVSTNTTLPRLSARRGLEVYNAEAVAICCAMKSTTLAADDPCRPIEPKTSWAVDARDSSVIKCRECTDETAESCGMEGAVVSEVQ
jgi:hypothetical protein